jgi:DNA topoisomerase II
VSGKLLEKIKKKEKSCKNLKAAHVKNHLWVFVNALIENPAFDSQTKETLNTRAYNFGSK